MTYIAVLDYDHLDNGIFLTAMARSLARQDGVRPIIIHGESAYTERLIQTGMMREDARIRCIKDLNNRLVALFADQGVSTIGINGYQRSFIARENGTLRMDKSYFNRLPARPVLLLSNIVANVESGGQEVIPLDGYLEFLRSELQPDEIFIFATGENEPGGSTLELPSEISHDELSKELREKYIPGEFQNSNSRFRLVTAEKFGNLPNLTASTLLR